MLTLYNKAKKDLEELTILDRTNEIAKQKLSEVIKNIYRVTVTQGKEVNLSNTDKVQEAKDVHLKTATNQIKVEPPKPVKKTTDMNKILQEYKVHEVTSIAR